MDQELQKLIHQLRDEKCPPAVLSRVARRVSREKTRARSWRFSLARAVSIAFLLCAVALWQWQARREARLLAAAQARAAHHALVAQQTRDAFGYIGQALRRAADRTENALLKEAVPPLRNGFETVKNKVTKPI